MDHTFGRSKTDPARVDGLELHESLVGRPTIVQSKSTPWILGMQPQKSNWNKHMSVSDQKGSHFDWFDSCWDELAGCIIFDFFHCYVWSLPLAALCIFGLMMVLTNYTVLGIPTCSQARHCQTCFRNGSANGFGENWHITVDPFQGSRLDIGGFGARWIILFVFISSANSAYTRASYTSYLSSGISTLVSSVWIHNTCLYTAGDTKQCSHVDVIDWGRYQPKSGEPLFSSDGTTTDVLWPKHVAEFCSFDELSASGATSNRVSDDNPQFDAKKGNSISNEVKNVWAAWMNLVTFNISLSQHATMMEYCRGLFAVDDAVQKFVIVPCLAWLNDTSRGNRIECLLANSSGLLELAIDAATRGETLLIPRDSPHGNREHMNLPIFLNDILPTALSRLKCYALVAGANFALTSPYDGRGSRALPVAAVADHIMSLVTRGLHCPVSWAQSGAGPEQAVGQNVSICTYAPGLVHSSGYRLQVGSDVTPYLEHDFVECVVGQVHTCQQRYFANSWTTVVSWANFINVFGIALLYLWMMYLYLSALKPKSRLFWLSIFEAVFISFNIWSLALFCVPFIVGSFFKTWPVPSHPVSSRGNGSGGQGVTGQEGIVAMSWGERVRTIFSSRIMLAFAAAVLLQLSFTYGMITVVLPIFDGRKERFCGQSRQCVFWLDLGSRACTYAQCLISMLAVAFNVRRYFLLRQQIMALPYNALFGEENIKEYEYNGPDLVDFKEMAASSVLLSMQFPGMVFWHFWVGSWVLVFALAFIVGPILVSMYGWNPRVWQVTSGALILASFHLSSYMTRTFVQRCLMHQPGYSSPDELERDTNDVHVRCLCLFSLWELWSCALGLALGPFDALRDFLRGLVTIALANLMVDRPSFTQFGELSDNVYCSYCASLYLERLREESRRRSRIIAVETATARNALNVEGVPEIERTGYRSKCPHWYVGFLFFQFIVPFLMVLLLQFFSRVLPVISGSKKYAP